MKTTLNYSHVRALDKAREDLLRASTRGREKRSAAHNALVAQAVALAGKLGKVVRQLLLQRSLNCAAAQERALPKTTAPVFPNTDAGRRAHAEYVAQQIAADNRADYNAAVEAHRRAPFLYQ